MNKTSVFLLIIGLVILKFCYLSTVIYAQDTKIPIVDNPLKREMRLLDTAFKNLIDSIVLNNPSAIEKPFHYVHEARVKTEGAIKNGEIKLPKNNERIEEFMKIDRTFHEKLELLINASRKGDLKKIKRFTHSLLDDCILCHAKFKNE